MCRGCNSGSISNIHSIREQGQQRFSAHGRIMGGVIFPCSLMLSYCAAKHNSLRNIRYGLLCRKSLLKQWEHKTNSALRQHNRTGAVSDLIASRNRRMGSMVLPKKPFIKRDGVSNRLNINILIRAVDACKLLRVNVDRRKTDDALAHIRQPARVRARRQNKGRAGHVRKNIRHALPHIIIGGFAQIGGGMVFVALPVRHLNAVFLRDRAEGGRYPAPDPCRQCSAGTRLPPRFLPGRCRICRH